MTLTLPKWFDLHTHFRQGPAMPSYVKAHLDMGCAGALAMPNTQPPVFHVRKLIQCPAPCMNGGASSIFWNARRLENIQAGDLPQRFGFDPAPKP